MANPFMDIFSGALSEANAQRANNQQLTQALQSMILEAKLKQMYDPEAQFRQQIMGLISGGGGGQPVPQLRPQMPIMPQNIPGAAMSLPSGGIGDVQGRPIDLASALSRMQAQPQTPPQVQQSAMAGGFRPTGFSYGGFTFENPEEKLRMEVEKAKALKLATLPTPEEIQQDIDIKTRTQSAIENVKPYSADEIKVASQKSLIPQIDKLIGLYKTKKVYEGPGVPFGASRISGFGEEGPWQTFKRGLTAGSGREAGLLLQNIKQLMFGPGGASLTEGERAVLGGMLNPAYKTEEKAIEDLITAKGMIEEKFRMLRANPNEAFSNNIPIENQSQQEIPLVGSMFNGEKVIRVRKIR